MQLRDQAGDRSNASPASPQSIRGHAGRAQAMVEFALALPVFLLLVYGLLEVGRLIFMEAAVASASRDGARYASAWGVNSSSTPQYQDCAGIRAAAKNVGILLGLSDTSIQISHDKGPSTTATVYCPSNKSVDTSFAPGSSACERVSVKVTAVYQPVLPLFLPLTTKNMASTTSRTLMGVIDLNSPTYCP